MKSVVQAIPNLNKKMIFHTHTLSPSSLPPPSYLQEGDEEEEGVSCPSELGVEEPRQESKNIILGRAAEEKQNRRGGKGKEEERERRRRERGVKKRVYFSENSY